MAGGLIHVGGWHGLEYVGEHERRLLIFEPGREAFAALTANLGGRENVELVNAAVGDSPGRALLHMTEPTHSSSLLTPQGPVTADHPVWFTGADEEVEVVALDAFVGDAGRYGVLRIDTQGNELAVLRGARRLLEGRRVGRVELEVHDPSTYLGAATLGELDDFMASVGWRQASSDADGSDGLADVVYEPAPD